MHRLSHGALPLITLITFCLAQTGVFAVEVQNSTDTGPRTSQSSVVCVDVPYAKALPAAQRECVQELFARRGKPFFFPSHDGIAYGVSWASNIRTLYLWADNQNENEYPLYVCCASTVFNRIKIFDEQGRRMLSKNEQDAVVARKRGDSVALSCSCSAWIPLAPHTMRIVDSAELSLKYNLSPGRYTIAEKYPPGPEENDEPSREALTGMNITLP